MRNQTANNKCKREVMKCYVIVLKQVKFRKKKKKSKVSVGFMYVYVFVGL